MLTIALIATALHHEPDLTERVTHHHADNNGVNLHYVSLGEGPLIIMLHGFPDFWLSWRHQMDALAEEHQVVAVDLRGYNRSDKPEGVGNYTMPLLISDVAAVIRDAGHETATVCGHDWGGAIAWSFAMYRPEMTERLMICNLPHPRGIRRELATNPQQQRNSTYARLFQQEGAHEQLSAAGLASIVGIEDRDTRAAYIEAFERSDFEAMLNYYKANFPRSTDEGQNVTTPEMPQVTCPVLMFHGLEDEALLASGLNDTWEWVDAELTIVTVPGAGHWVHHDAADVVTRTMADWLDR